MCAEALQPLTKLHSLFVTVGVYEGEDYFNPASVEPWAGECTNCQKNAAGDSAYRKSIRKKKDQSRKLMPNLTHVEWTFTRTYPSDWGEIIRVCKFLEALLEE